MIAVSALALPARQGTDYPPPHDAPCLNRIRRALGDVFGLSQFGVNMLDLPPGTWSSQRHWHEQQDEFVPISELVNAPNVIFVKPESGITSIADLVAAIRRFCDAWNERCHPFVWVKDADDIMVKATRKRTSGTDTSSGGRRAGRR